MIETSASLNASPRGMSLSRKLPLVNGGVGLLVTAVLVIGGTWQAGQMMREDKRETFEIIAAERADDVTALGESLERSLSVQVASQGAQVALGRFIGGWNSGGETAAETYRRLYVTDNPNAPGQRIDLVHGGDESFYSSTHAELHPQLAGFVREGGLKDLLLITPDGRVVYSARKNDDFGSDVVNGPLAESPLGHAFAAAIGADPGAVTFVDFESYAAEGGAPAAFLAAPVHALSGEVLGVMALSIDPATVASVLDGLPILGETGTIYLAGADGRARTPAGAGQQFGLLDRLPSHTVDNAGERPDSGNTLGLSGNEVLAVDVPLRFLGETWDLVVEQDLVEAHAERTALFRSMFLQLALISVAVAIYAILQGRWLTRRIGRLAVAVQHISDREYDTELDEARRGDEIGDIARRLLVLTERLIASDMAETARQKEAAAQAAVMSRLSDALKDLANGNLDCRIADSFPHGFEPLRADFNASVETLASAIGAVTMNAEKIAEGAANVAQASADLSNRTEQQAATLEETAGSIDTLTASVREAAKSAGEVEKTVESARGEAEASGSVVREAVGAMSRIEDSSKQITQIIDVIEDIAFQTNLLALNAGVEAARAGEVGKGFAVVATEVRALAQRSSASAQEIRQLISDSSTHVENGVVLVGNAGSALEGIVERVGVIADLIGKIASVARDQAQGLGEVNSGVNALDQMTQQNAAMAEEVTAAGQSLREESSDLRKRMSRFVLPKPTPAKPIPSKPPQTLAPEPAPKIRRPPVRLAVGAESHPVREASDQTENIWQDF